MLPACDAPVLAPGTPRLHEALRTIRRPVLAQRRRVVPWPAHRGRVSAIEAQLPQIEYIDEDIDSAGRAVLEGPVIESLGEENALRSILPFDVPPQRLLPPTRWQIRHRSRQRVSTRPRPKATGRAPTELSAGRTDSVWLAGSEAVVRRHQDPATSGRSSRTPSLAGGEAPEGSIPASRLQLWSARLGHQELLAMGGLQVVWRCFSRPCGRALRIALRRRRGCTPQTLRA